MNRSATTRGALAQESLEELSQAAGGGLKMLQAVADELEEALFVVDRDQTILLFNKQAEALTGFSRDQVVGQHCLKGIRCERCLKSCGVFERGVVKDVPLDLFRSDGTELEVIKNAAVLRDEEGEAIGAVEVLRPRVESTNRTSTSHQLETMMNALGRGFLIVGVDFVIVEVSASLGALLGRPTDELVGQPAERLLGEELFRLDSPFRVGLERGERREGWRATVSTSSGETQVVSVTGAPLSQAIGSEGPPSQYLLMVRPESPPAELRDAELRQVEGMEGMVARSASMLRVFSLIEHLADHGAPVLIYGESGTGKELVARAIHARSTRANRPFVAVNCGALPGELLESELFGHARGAFTGAVRDKPGRFEAAEDGTVFLDEIGDLPLPLQVKLLRVLQERTFERLGEVHSRPLQARVVAATNQDLAQLVAEKRFRQDLFYRLNVVPILLPPLRERREDLDILVQHLLEKIGQRRSRSLRLAPAAMRALLSYDWPGNVRQLENALEYATAVCEGQTIHREDLPVELVRESSQASQAEQPAPAPAPSISDDGSTTIDRYPTVDDMVRALRQTRYRRAKAAELLGVSRTTLWRRMREEGLGQHTHS